MLTKSLHALVQQPRAVLFVPNRSIRRDSIAIRVEKSTPADDLRHASRHPPHRVRQREKLDGAVGATYRAYLRAQVRRDHLGFLGEDVEEPPSHRARALQEQSKKNTTSVSNLIAHTRISKK